MPSIAIVYNEPIPGRYEALGEKTAVLGILEEVEAVNQALIELGYSAVPVPLLPPIDRARQTLNGLRADLVFNLFEGFDGSPETESAVAGMLSARGVPFTGCAGTALSRALDKSTAKALLQAAGIGTPAYHVLSVNSLATFHLRYPCIVKPCAEDASHGISERSVVNDGVSLGEQVELVCQDFGGLALVEEYLEGREFNATVLGAAEHLVLPISEIVYSLPDGMPKILAFPAKWEPESVYSRSTIPVCPAKIEPELQRELESCAVSVFQLFGCSGYARVDFRLDAEGRPFVLEVNPNCDISPTSGAARQARAAGMSYVQFIDRIVRFALQDQAP